MKKTILFISLFFLIHKNSSAQTDSVKYHDDQMESQWGSSTSNDDFGCFVRFTPTSYPALLTGVRGYFRNAGVNSTIRWKVYRDTSAFANGGVSVAWQSPFIYMNPAAGGNVDQQYDMFTDLTSDSILITAGDIYVGAVQSNDYFGIGIDNAPDDSVATDRQWQWMTVFGNNYWNTFSSQASSGQFGITAYFNSNPLFVNTIENSSAKIYISSDNKLNVYMNENLTTSLYVVSLTGEIVASKTFRSNTNVEMNNLSSGVYIVKLTNENGNTFKKIFKN